MPKSPIVNFNLINNNIEVTKPTNGISLVLARTTSGLISDSSTIVNSVTKFRQLYGSEIVPDGTLSNIEKALKGGSKLRIIRVVGDGASGPFVATTRGATEADAIFTMSLSNGIFEGTNNINFMLKGKESAPDLSKYSNVQVKLTADSNGNLYITTHDGETVISRDLLWNIYINGNSTVSFDYSTLDNFISSNQYFDIYWKTTSETLSSENWGVPLNWTKGGVNMVNFFKSKIDGITLAGTETGLDISIYQNTSTSSSSKLFKLDADGLELEDGNNYEVWYIEGAQGATPTLAQWEEAAEHIRDIQDVYAVAASHINQHLEQADELALHKYIADIANECEEFQYFIELPVTASDTYETLVAKAKTYQGTIGKSKWVCYFSGGIKYYNTSGVLTDSNVMGTILGLADDCASKYGPYRSFAGLNRGVINDGNGPVIPNYGSPSRYDQLNELAEACVNMIVLKQTRTSGLATVLWHSFTSQIKQDSFRYIHAVRLALYIKKQIRPILESYIEEPNIWSSWKRIYLESKPIMDGLITDNAISEYTWDGDQDATDWEDLTVNNESDVRNGKYSLNIRVKDVATLQDITVNLVYDQASNTTSAAITSI